MAETPLRDVTTLVTAANASRGWRDGSERVPTACGADAEERLDALFGISRRLAVYGTLAPGRQNHYVVAPLGEEWTEGIVEGDLWAEGWGAALPADERHLYTVANIYAAAEVHDLLLEPAQQKPRRRT